MKKLFLFFIVNLILVLNLSHAKMTWEFEGYPVCNDSVESELYAVNTIFCHSTKNFSRHAFCAEALCLLQKHASHCDANVYESVSRLEMFFMQDSNEVNELGLALDRYCYEDNY